MSARKDNKISMMFAQKCGIRLEIVLFLHFIVLLCPVMSKKERFN